ncbi:SCO4225 family membrane protein [Streptomyces sp. enrichment culture]|uniref:SCO4225 family membrane protein n=1 Tax=Streptomyces sp. enrichment culture TaxID=1795815 RepID=UPI003F56C35E
MGPNQPVTALRAFARPAFGDVASGVYLAVVAAVTALVIRDLWFTEHEDASFAALGLMAVAAPTILVLLAGGELAGDGLTGSSWFLWAAFGVSVLLQSVAVGALARPAARGTRHRPRPRRGRGEAEGG